MELPVLDNEFLSLFIPENSEFSSDEILDDFKFYIFIISKLSVDALIQEGVRKCLGNYFFIFSLDQQRLSSKPRKKKF
jgi:hypothetical protein